MKLVLIRIFLSTILSFCHSAYASTRVDLKYATIELADDAIDQHAKGKDSSVAVYQSPRYRLSFDHSEYTANPDSTNGPQKEKGFQQNFVTIDGRKAVIWSYQIEPYAKNPAIYFYSVHFDEKNGPGGITLSAQCPAPSCKNELLKAFYSIRFAKKLK